MVEDGPEGVAGVLARRGVLDRLADGDAEGSRGVRIRGKEGSPRVGVPAGGRDDLRPPGLHEHAAVRLLVVAHLHHVHLHLEAEERAGEGHGGTPLPRPRLRRDPLSSRHLVVIRLGDGGVRLVAPRGTDALVLVVDLRLRPDGLLEPKRAEHRSRPPEGVDVPDRLGDRDLPLRRHFLLDQRHGEQRGEIAGADRLAGSGMEHRRRRVRHVRHDVVPGFRYFRVLEEKLHLHRVGSFAP